MTTVVVGLRATVPIILSPVITEGHVFLKALPIAAAIPVVEEIWLEDSPLRSSIPPPPPEPMEEAA